MTVTITVFERLPDVGRGEARPAYRRAFDARLSVDTAAQEQL